MALLEPRTEFVFVWYGGANIDIFHDHTEVPFHNWNVWDYEHDCPVDELAERTFDEFATYVLDRLSEDEEYRNLVVMSQGASTW